MKVILCIAALIAVSSAVPVELGPETIASSFGSFVNVFSKSYANAEESALREKIFNLNVKKIEFLNSLNDGVQYAINEFTDMTEDEFKARLGFTQSADVTTLNVAEPLDVSAAPDNIDWVAKGAVTPVKNQGQCGSCWAFSTVVDIEGKNFLKNGKLTSLSEQDLVDCDKVDQGCQGGLPSQAFQFLIDSQGGKIATEESYGYKGVGGTCNFAKATTGATITGWEKVSTDEDQIKAFVAANGPVSIGINAGPMQFYRSGIAKASKLFCNPSKLDHGVAIVGYGVENGVKFWKIKNSWGTSWGEKGYYRIVRGEGACGLNTMVTSSKL
jgi:cathepsin F